MYIYCICVYEYSIYLYVVYRLELLDTYHILILTIVFLDETRKLFAFQVLATFSSFRSSITKIEHSERIIMNKIIMNFSLDPTYIFIRKSENGLCAYSLFNLSMLKRLCNRSSKCYLGKSRRDENAPSSYCCIIDFRIVTVSIAYNC